MNSGSSSDSQANQVNAVPVQTKSAYQEQQKKRHSWLLWVLVVVLVSLLVWALSSGKGLGVQCYSIKGLPQLCAGLSSAANFSSTSSNMSTIGLSTVPRV
jgi:hypothetical protein